MTEKRPVALVLAFSEPMPYQSVWSLQQALHEARVAERIPDTVLLLQHTPTITLGRRLRDQGLLLPHEEYARRGIALHHASRGGDVTWHGPGQWVLYPVIHLGGAEADAHGVLWNFEETAIRTAAQFGIRAFRRKGLNGAWTNQGKIAAIGFHLRRWVLQHGMSFNVCPDLRGFKSIIPCGLKNETVSSMADIHPDDAPSMEASGQALLHSFEAVFGRSLYPENIEQPGHPLLAEILVDWKGKCPHGMHSRDELNNLLLTIQAPKP